MAMDPLETWWWGQTRSLSGGLQPVISPLACAVSMKGSNRLLSSSTNELAGAPSAVGGGATTVVASTAVSATRDLDHNRIAVTTSVGPAGFLRGRWSRNRELPAADVLDVDMHVAERYSQIYCDLRESGTPIPTNDMWIAATASANGMAVLTFDGHFNAIPQVPSLVLEI
jgi:PIN domain